MAKNHKKVIQEREPISLNKNEKQKLLFRYVKGIVEGTCKKRVIFYGGAIRGGKTIGSLACLLYLAIEYPGSKTIIIRNTHSSLKSSTLDSFKIVVPSHIISSVNYSDMEWTLVNGSRFQFFAESYKSDKDLDKFKGLECNFILLEQVEELQETTFNKSLERVGSYRLPNGQQPPGIILATFNPTQNWVKDRVYRPHVLGELPDTWEYISALPTDNPFVTEDQKNSWATMDSLSRKRFIEGDWEAMSTDNLFAWAFSVKDHVKMTPSVKRGSPYYISFDFNVDPMCAIVLSYASENKFHVAHEFKIPNSDVISMCRTIRGHFGDNIVAITGDASGRSRNQASIELGSHYDIIKKELNLNKSQIQISNFNLHHLKSQVIVNAVLEQHPDFAISPTCKNLIADLLSIKMLNSGSIDKSDSKMGHLLDAFRYACARWSHKIIKTYDIDSQGNTIVKESGADLMDEKILKFIGI